MSDDPLVGKDFSGWTLERKIGFSQVFIPEAVHREGFSVRGQAISEDLAGPIEQHLILPPGVELADD